MKKYMWQLTIPIIILIICVSYLVTQPGGLSLDVDFKGGTEIVIDSSQPFDTTAMGLALKQYDATVREAKSLTSYSTMINFDDSISTTDVVNTLKSSGFMFDRYSVQSVSPMLSASFFSQAMMVLCVSFVFMFLVILYIFRSPLIGTYIALCPAFDIIETLAITQMLGMKLSLAGFTALIMIIGYSVGGDNVIATRALKRGDIPMDERFRASLKTSLTMHLATMAALVGLFLLSVSGVITTIAIYLLIGLTLDLQNTWLLDANLLRWHIDRKGVK